MQFSPAEMASRTPEAMRTPLAELEYEDRTPRPIAIPIGETIE
jgi:hypothetical protein